MSITPPPVSTRNRGFSYPAAAADGFPYEGKLSPEATDEVDSAA